MSRAGVIAKWSGLALLAVLLAGLIAPYLQADAFGSRIRDSLQRTLGRKVEIGQVRFDLFRGPGFRIENVVIHEDPSIGIEPMARVNAMEVSPRLFPLLRGRLEAGSIRLEDARINLAKTGAPSEPGRWNFERLVNPAGLSSFPAVRIRNGRINFKFGDTKSAFYLTGADLDISPESRDWRISCEAQPARTDRAAQGLGTFTVNGKWILASSGGRLDLDARLERTGLGEIMALLRGSDGGVHGTVSSRVRLTGPLRDIRIAGRLTIEDVHRWDLLPPKGEGWPLDVRGRLDLVSQQLELESNSAGNVELPLYARFRVADYLAQPKWGVSVNWNRFPAGPLLELARHMGAQLPPKLQLTGTIDGAIVYSGQGSFQGQMSFQKPVLTVPDSAPLRCDAAALVFGQGHARLQPAAVRVVDDEDATVEADYDTEAGTLDLDIRSEGMNVASLRTQVALAAVPWLEQLESGEWSGQLHYRRGARGEAGWTGKLSLAGATLPVPGFASPVRLRSARAQIDGARVVLDKIDASAGPVAVTGEYRYEPQAARPHRVRLAAAEIDAAGLEAQFAPTLRRGGLIARAFGRIAVPDWMKSRNVEGTLRIGVLQLAGARLENVRGHLLWDVTRAELNGIQARLEKGAVTGTLTVGLRGARPAYRFAGRVKGLAWQGGKLDAEGTIDTAGTGSQLLAGMVASGSFSGAGLDVGGPLPLRAVSGSYKLAWTRNAPQFRFTDLEIETADDTYTGRGETQEDGRLVLVLSNGTREMRVSGTLAKLHLDEAATGQQVR